MRLLALLTGFSLLLAPLGLSAQDRDVRGERLVLDDNGGGGTTNTMTIMPDPALSSNIMLTIPDPGGPAQFLLAPPGTAGAWFLGGNAGTTFGTDLLGTSDNTALQIGVNGGASNSLILNTNGSIQRDNGGHARGARSVDFQLTRLLSTQVASGNSSFVGTGTGNTASGDGSFVGTGIGNTASGVRAFVGAGLQNSATSLNSAVVAGYDNTVESDHAFIGGGASNTVSSTNATIVAGTSNTIANTGVNGFIGAGTQNNISGSNSVIPGGRGLTLSGNGSLGFLGGNTGSNDMTVSAANTAIFGNTDLWLANNDNAASQLRFYEAQATTGAFPAAGTNYTAFVAGAQTGDITYTLPTAAPSAGQVLHSDASGNLNWAAAGTSGVVFNRVTTSGPTYNAASTDGIIGVDVTGGPVTINLPDASTIANGCTMIINVEQGNAGTNNVTINAAAGDTFDGTGATSLVISFAQGQFKFYSDGADGWFTY